MGSMSISNLEVEEEEEICKLSMANEWNFVFTVELRIYFLPVNGSHDRKEPIVPTLNDDMLN